MRDVYTAFTGSFFGKFLGNSFVPYLIFFLGSKKTIQLGGILYFLQNYYFAEFPSKITLYIGAIFNGFVFQFKSLPVNFFMSKKYENGILYSDHIYSGFSISAFFWSLVLTFIINPNNEKMDKITYINGYEEKYFNKTISDRVKIYYLLNGIVSLIIILIFAQFIKEPSNFTPSYKYYYKKFFGNLTEEDKINFNSSLEKIKKDPILDSNSSISINLNKKILKEKSNSLLENKPEKEETMEFHREIANKEMKKPKFILLILIFVLKAVSCSYF